MSKIQDVLLESMPPDEANDSISNEWRDKCEDALAEFEELEERAEAAEKVVDAAIAHRKAELGMYKSQAMDTELHKGGAYAHARALDDAIAEYKATKGGA